VGAVIAASGSSFDTASPRPGSQAIQSASEYDTDRERDITYWALAVKLKKTAEALDARIVPHVSLVW